MAHALSLLRQFARTLFTALYHRQAQYIMLKKIESQPAGRLVSEGGKATEIACQVVDSVAALYAVPWKIPAAMRDSVAQLAQRVRQGCLVILAWRPHKAEPSREVIAYMVCERGVFSALGRKGKVSSDLLFTHYLEVLAPYRGQRMAQVLRGVRDEYCRAQGVPKRCSTIALTNEASLRSSLRDGATIVGTVVRLSILRGVVVWETPWAQIERALRQEPGVNRWGQRKTQQVRARLGHSSPAKSTSAP
jgi:hypothetical protein